LALTQAYPELFACASEQVRLATTHINEANSRELTKMPGSSSDIGLTDPSSSSWIVYVMSPSSISIFVTS
jgi:hypothetical protein